MGSGVALNGYTVNNPYEFDSDGYIVLYTDTTADYIQVRIVGSNGTTFYIKEQHTQYGQSALFVKKGMKCYVESRSNDGYIAFMPLY